MVRLEAEAEWKVALAVGAASSWDVNPARRVAEAAWKIPLAVGAEASWNVAMPARVEATARWYIGDRRLRAAVGRSEWSWRTLWTGETVSLTQRSRWRLLPKPSVVRRTRTVRWRVAGQLRAEAEAAWKVGAGERARLGAESEWRTLRCARLTGRASWDMWGNPVDWPAYWRYRGRWSATAIYEVGDVVAYGNGIWTCSEAGAGHRPNG
jgi:hypothetical protein